MVRLSLIVCASLLVLSACQSARGIVSAPVPNPGPCPNALSLYDAHRLVEINGEDILFNNVGFTGEILGVSNSCRYTNLDNSAIDNALEVDMAFGRGPAAVGDTHTYELFISIIGFNDVVIDKQIFPVTVTFEPGVDRVNVVERFDPLLIPRAEANTSGINFEILVGFELTDDQLEFNRSGLRFRLDAGQN